MYLSNSYDYTVYKVLNFHILNQYIRNLKRFKDLKKVILYVKSLMFWTVNLGIPSDYRQNLNNLFALFLLKMNNNDISTKICSTIFM